MELLAGSREAVDLTGTPLHLGLGGGAAVVAGFSWDADVLEAYNRSAS
jgi:hypothetical protein